ncbi:MAG: hypothetical protein H7070_02360 [Saprospiraceae bacterium]|nr:hypothetical protein [Pyrinomonadaceae bacterium]
MKCPNCKLVNYADAEFCARCSSDLTNAADIKARVGFLRSNLMRRAVVCLIVCFAVIAGFYASLVFSASSLTSEEKRLTQNALRVLEEKGFPDEIFFLRRLAVFRNNDNWLNASVEKENAYAATNFPFEIVTLYPDFFTYPLDDTERAAILLHEAKHLQGKDEKEAYEFVWKNRNKLGWSGEKYNSSAILDAVRNQTKEMSPNLFVCDVNPYGDCTE